MIQEPPPPPPVPPLPVAGIDFESGVVDGDVASYLEELVFEELLASVGLESAEGLLIELVGPHLRIAGNVQIGYHRRLSDFINNHEGLMKLHDARVLRRNGDPTKVTAASIWVSPAEVTLIGQESEPEASGADPAFVTPKRVSQLIVVTPGHTITGEVHLNLEATVAAFIESPDPFWVPMTDVRTRSLADRRVISRYDFALLNRRHIVAATELQPGMIRGRAVL
jgi:hypothetical protein